MVSYSRARAEGLNIECKVGFLERPERVVLLIIGSLTEVSPATYAAVASVSPFVAEFMFFKMRAVLWVLAVLSHWTVIHRVYEARGELLRADGFEVGLTNIRSGRTRRGDEMLGSSVRQSWPQSDAVPR
jgi:CDP-diacylglycerol--glycerol-3-phosphate 3-phosphatidyltransferase